MTKTRRGEDGMERRRCYVEIEFPPIDPQVNSNFEDKIYFKDGGVVRSVHSNFEDEISFKGGGVVKPARHKPGLTLHFRTFKFRGRNFF